MNKKLAKALKEANTMLKKDNLFKNHHITINGDFSGIYNEIDLSTNDEVHHFPITYAETEGEAIAAINAYMTGLRHGREKSYPRICDQND